MLKVERLDDEFLEGVSGGSLTVKDVAFGAGIGVLTAFGVASIIGLGCEMVALVYGSKSSGALVEEDWEDYYRYNDESILWANRGADIMTLGITAAIGRKKNINR